MKLRCAFVWLIILMPAVMPGCSHTSGTEIEKGSVSTVLYVQTGRIIDDVYFATSSFHIGDKANFKIIMSDNDLDICRLYIRGFHPKDAEEPIFRYKPIELKPQKEIRENYVLETPFEVTGPPGEWRLELQVEDVSGNLSNAYKAFIIVH